MPEREDTFYAASNARIGFGAQLLVGDGASPSGMSAVANVKSITMGETSLADVVRTHLRSPNRHHEHAAGLADTTPLTVTVEYDPAEWSHRTAGGGSKAFASGGLPVICQDGVDRDWVVRLPFSPEVEVEITGYGAGFSIGELNAEGVIEATFRVMPTQAMVLP